MKTTSQLFWSFLFCFAASLLSGCGGESVPTLTPAEQAEVDKYVKNHGRDALAVYLYDKRVSKTDEQLVSKYSKYFVSQGADVNASIKREGSIYTPIRLVISRRNIELARFLISKGVDINARDDKNSTPLEWAIRVTDFEMVKFLISQGADVNICGDMPLLHVAVGLGPSFYISDKHIFRDEKEVLEIVKILVSAGANINAKLGNGQTPLDLAKEARWNKAVIDYLSGLK